MLRTGKQYIESLKDGREVYVGGELVTDVTTHPAFQSAVKSMARIYDITSDPQNADTFSYTDEDGGERYNMIFKRPRSKEDLTARRRVHQAWAAATFGQMGRTPDHVGSFVTGMACLPSIFNTYNQGFDKNILAYWEHVRKNDLYLAYAVVPSPRAKGQGAVRAAEAAGHTYDDRFLPDTGLRVVSEDDNGVTVWGTKTLATGAVIADEVLIGTIRPLRPGEEKSAITFAIPMGAPGLKIISRKPFSKYAVSPVDDPLGYHFDETDAVLFFDNVKVPWERVFVHNNLDLAGRIFYDTPAHTLGNAQAHIRLLEKLRVLLGLTERLAEVTGNMRFVRDKINALAVKVAVLEGLIEAQEANPEAWEGGYVSQDRQTMYATLSWSMGEYPYFVTEVRKLLASHAFNQPADFSVFENDVTTKLHLTATGLSSREHAIELFALMRLIWDMIGSEHASRHLQYEMFYGGARHVSRSRAGHFFRWDAVREAANSALSFATRPSRTNEPTLTA